MNIENTLKMYKIDSVTKSMKQFNLKKGDTKMLKRIETITSHEAYEYTLDKSYYFLCVRVDKQGIYIKTDKEVSMDEMNQYLQDNIVLAEDEIRIKQALQIVYEDMTHNPMNLKMEK